MQDTTTETHTVGGYHYVELKSDSVIFLFEVKSAYGDKSNPGEGFSVCIKHPRWPIPADALHHAQFSKSQREQAELLFEALTKTDEANRCGLLRGYSESLRRAQRPVEKLPMF